MVACPRFCKISVLGILMGVGVNALFLVFENYG
jgi:hypothetical protein